MIPASYLYKDIYARSWGDPRNMQAEPAGCEPGGPSKGHLVGLSGLLAGMLPLEVERSRFAWPGMR